MWTFRLSPIHIIGLSPNELTWMTTLDVVVKNFIGFLDKFGSPNHPLTLVKGQQWALYSTHCKKKLIEFWNGSGSKPFRLSCKGGAFQSPNF
jgi:hypothetical protein